jgi:hypothetical protein
MKLSVSCNDPSKVSALRLVRLWDIYGRNTPPDRSSVPCVRTNSYDRLVHAMSFALLNGLSVYSIASTMLLLASNVLKDTVPGVVPCGIFCR